MKILRKSSHVGKSNVVLAASLGLVGVGLILWLLFELLSLVLELDYKSELLSALAVVVVFSIAIAPWLEFLWRKPTASSRVKFRFSVKTMLWTTAILAAYLAGLQNSSSNKAKSEHKQLQESAMILEIQLRQFEAEFAAETAARIRAEKKVQKLLKNDNR